jgi:hypothetical protein
VRTSLLVLGSTMRNGLDLVLRDASELSRGCVVGGGATGTCCGCWGW